MSSTNSKYEIPEAVNESLLITLGKDVEMQTFKTNVVPERESDVEEDKQVVLLCVGTITGKENVSVKEHFRRTPPKGSCLPTVCMDIHLKKIKLSSQNEKQLSAIYEVDPEGYKGFNFKSCHGGVVFWTPEYPSSLSEVEKWMETINDFANSRIPCVLLTFNSTNLEWIGSGKMFESETALEQFCRDQGFVKWFEMRGRNWDGAVFERAIAFLKDHIQTDETLK